MTLLDGTRLTNVTMSNDGENLIWIRGTDTVTNEEREVTVGPHPLQIEFLTLEKPPPELQIVK